MQEQNWRTRRAEYREGPRHPQATQQAANSGNQNEVERPSHLRQTLQEHLHEHGFDFDLSLRIAWTLPFGGSAYTLSDFQSFDDLPLRKIISFIPFKTFAHGTNLSFVGGPSARDMELHLLMVLMHRTWIFPFLMVHFAQDMDLSLF